jgi:hypothetical protein
VCQLAWCYFFQVLCVLVGFGPPLFSLTLLSRCTHRPNCNILALMYQNVYDPPDFLLRKSLSRILRIRLEIYFA